MILTAEHLAAAAAVSERDHAIHVRIFTTHVREALPHQMADTCRTVHGGHDRLDGSDQLAPTILYNLNPRDNEVLATMLGNFQDARVPGKMQYGRAWWFLDQLDGMQKRLNALSNMGLLSRFVGMLTDSRSFLSYSRHEYFRRLLCNMLGEDVRRGLVPDDRALLGELVRAVCFDNARAYFPFPDAVA